MSAVEDQDLSPAAARLARAAPREWEEFKLAFKKYADKTKDHCVQAQLDELQKSQGRAQQTAKLAVLFDDAVNAADRISERAGKLQQNPRGVSNA